MTTLPQNQPGPPSPRDGFTRYQHQQLARLKRADRWIHGRAQRAIDRGDPLYRIYRRLRRGLIEVLRAALFEAGDKSAGNYRWLALVERAGTLLPATPAQRQALAIIAAMPFLPDELPWRDSREKLLNFLAACHHYQRAAWTVQHMAGPVAGASIGIEDGRWLRLASGRACIILRWNGIVALLGDIEARDVIDYFDLLGALLKNRLMWIDDAGEIGRLSAGLVSPLPENYWRTEDEDDADDDDAAEAAGLAGDVAPDPDPDRAAMVLLQACEIAGLPYHQADSVADRLLRGLRLQLVREPDNAFDTEAVSISMDTGEKLGYVPRRCNAGIARRLDAGVTLSAWLTRVAWTGNPAAGKPRRIDIDIRSQDPSDIPDVEVDNGEVVNGIPALPASQRAARSQWQSQFAFDTLEQARRALGRNTLGEMLERVDRACQWAREAWLFHQGHTPDILHRRTTLERQFSQATGASGLGSEVAQLQHELRWRSKMPASGERDTALALCLLRIELLWRQHLRASDGAALDAVRVINPSPAPAMRPGPVMPLAQRYPLLRRIEALRPLRRLLRVIQRVECGLPASTADLRGLRLFNRDLTLLRAVLRQLIHTLREDLRGLLHPAEDGRCREPDEQLLRLYPHSLTLLLPNRARWQLVNEAAALLEQADPDLPALQALRVQLYLLQPQTRRVGRHQRRHATDHALFMTEKLIECATTLDMLDIVNSLCVAMPMDRRDKLLSAQLWCLFDALCIELFGQRRVDMLQAWPVLLTEAAPPLDFALMAWSRVMTDIPDAGDLLPAQRAARTLLLEALIGYSGPWPHDLEKRIPAPEKLCPL